MKKPSRKDMRKFQWGIEDERRPFLLRAFGQVPQKKDPCSSSIPIGGLLVEKHTYAKAQVPLIEEMT